MASPPSPCNDEIALLSLATVRRLRDGATSSWYPFVWHRGLTGAIRRTLPGRRPAVRPCPRPQHGDDAVTMTRRLIETLDALRRVEERLKRLDPNPVPGQARVPAARR